jgi:hypothetical protein
MWQAGIVLANEAQLELVEDRDCVLLRLSVLFNTAWLMPMLTPTPTPHYEQRQLHG